MAGTSICNRGYGQGLTQSVMPPRHWVVTKGLSCKKHFFIFGELMIVTVGGFTEVRVGTEKKPHKNPRNAAGCH